jgi:hypothetical protein
MVRSLQKPGLGSTAGPVIQATGKSTFEDDLRSGGSSSDFKAVFFCHHIWSLIWTVTFFDI